MVSLDRSQNAVRDPLPQDATTPPLAPPSFVLALGPLLLLYGLYSAVRWGMIDRAEDTGDHNAHAIIRFEHWLGIDVEQTLQIWLLNHGKLLWLFNHYYVAGFFPVLILAAIWGYHADSVAFHSARRVFALSLAVALVIFVLAPLTPPRLLPAGYGYLDTLRDYGPHYYGDASGASFFNGYGALPNMVNEYAAMPSMHVGWSIIAAWLLYVATGRRFWVAWLACAHVLMMATVVVSTGNHYLVDGVVGALVVALAWMLVGWFEQRKPASTSRSGPLYS